MLINNTTAVKIGKIKIHITEYIIATMSYYIVT